MSLTLEETRRLADLARLELKDDELERLSRELDSILQYVGRLSAVDTAGVPETAEGALASPPAADEVTACDPETRELIVTGFPDRLGDALRVPAVFERPKS
jgi:aspartyl-tRNA(Asn)/glutamyl-tRNA(Gln) amidotransferase subunit C